MASIVGNVMGMFRTVSAVMSCAACKAPFPASVQFKTGADWLEEYEEGGVTDLPAGEYEGIADGYCKYCSTRWRADEKAAWFDEIAAAVLISDLYALYGTYRVEHLEPVTRVLRVLREVPLTADELRTLGRLPTRWYGSFSAYLDDASILLFHGGRLVEPFDARWPSRDAVRRRLSTRGWPVPADEPYQDVPVRIGDDGRITIVRA